MAGVLMLAGHSGRSNVRARRASEERQGFRLRRHDPQGARAARPGREDRRPVVGRARLPVAAARHRGGATRRPWPATPSIRRRTASLPLKKAVQKKFKRDNNLDYALDEIMVSNGSKQIMYDAMMASVNPGDEVIIPAPGWISYADQVKLARRHAGRRCRARRTTTSSLRAADLDAAITAKTKWVVLNFPNNPTGAVCTRAEMREHRRRAAAAPAGAGHGGRDLRAPASMTA